MDDCQVESLVEELNSEIQGLLLRNPSDFAHGKACGLAAALQMIEDFHSCDQKHRKTNRCTPWEEQDEAKLMELVGERSWSDISTQDRQQIADELKRTPFGCRDRWQKLQGLRS